MTISYLGKGCVKVQHGDLVVALNPPARDASGKTPRFGADIVLSSMNEPNWNGVDQVAYGSKTPFVIDGPGEYEVGGVYIKGVLGDRADRKKTRDNPTGMRLNTVYTMLLDGLHVAHAGAQSKSEFAPGATEEIGPIDILFVPIAGGDVMDAKEAARFAKHLEARVVIPVCTPAKGAGDATRTFVREFGSEAPKPVDKFTPKRKEVEGKEGEVVVLKEA